MIKNRVIYLAGSVFFNQGTNSIALVLYSGQFNQSENCLAIGPKTGIKSQPKSNITINAGNLALTGTTQNASYIQPLRNFVTGGSLQM